MAATIFGAGVFGIPLEETGILIDSISFNYSSDKKELPGRTGDTKGIAYFNEKVEVSFGGAIPATAAFSGTLAASLTLLNSIPDHLKGTVTGGSIMVEEVSVEYSAEDFQMIEVKAVLYPFVS